MGHQERAAASAAVLADRAATTRLLLQAVQDEIPTYRDLPEVQLREAGAIVDWATQRLLGLWVAGGRLEEPDLRRMHGIGVARATDGRPLLDVLRAYRVASTAAADLVLEHADRVDTHDVVALSRLLLASLDSMTQALLEGYTLATERLRHDREHVLDGLVADLLSGRQTTAATLADRTRRLGITVPDPLTLVVVVTADGAAPTAGEVADLAHVVARPHGTGADAEVTQDPLHGTAGGTGVVLAAGASDLEAELTFRRWRACVVDDLTPQTLPRAFDLAASAVLHAPAEALSTTPVLGRADALAIAHLRGRPAVDPLEIVQAVLGPVLAPAQAHVLEGLEAHTRHGTSTQAAQALGLHPQTMRHRLRRLAALTGRDLDHPWDRLLLHTAHTIRRLP
ncbi:PucR family transcriptional regulator [Solicola sp. PLA-1-18]|uniref:PucR family transcriptional regulator n=1 Tax=Solicola sp. PLA-1-18 TaxID=3380532 RepID=UPI003B7606F7